VDEQLCKATMRPSPIADLVVDGVRNEKGVRELKCNVVLGDPSANPDIDCPGPLGAFKRP
jgi:hypothetical protein